LREQLQAESIWCGVIRHRADEEPDRFAIRHSPAAGHAAAEMLPEHRVDIRTELAVDVGIEIALDIIAGHRTRSINGTAAVSIVARRSRARASRDMTVPIGTRTIAAISL